MSQALVKLDVGKLISAKPLNSVQEVTSILNQLRAEDAAFVLTPLALVDHVKPFHQVSLRVLYINPTVTKEKDRNGKEIWKQGPHCYFNSAFMSPGEVGLSKNGLVAILAAGGANPVTVRLDDRSDSNLAEFQAVVYHQDLDGLWRQYPGNKLVDLRDGSRDAKAMTEGRLNMARQFTAENAETKAILRALRPLFGLSQVYKADDLKRKPFVVPKLVKHWDLSDPDQKHAAIQEAMGHEGRLFGGIGPGGADRIAPPELPAGNSGEAARALPPGQTVTPPTTTPPAEDDAFDSDLPDFDKPSLVVCSCPCGCQKELTPEIAERTKAALKGVSRCETCYPGPKFDHGTHKDLKSLEIPRYPNVTADEIRDKWAAKRASEAKA